MEITIIYGNGINLPDENNSWDGILKRLAINDIPSQITSNTLKYEYIVLPQKESIFSAWIVGGKFLMSGGRPLGRIANTENDIIKSKICYELTTRPPSCLYKELTSIKANHYITTNYELFLNDAFISLGYTIEEKNIQESRLFRYNLARKGDDSIKLWNIHGDVKKPSSVMLGFAQYCQSVVDINNTLNNKERRDKNSWIDVFLNTDVHIVGFGFYEEEIDLWYLLVYRMREYRHTNVNKNTIYYYLVSEGNVDKDRNKISLLEAFNVKVIVVEKKGTWEDAYKKIFNIIRDSVGCRELNI